jgi:predicted transposase YbfD/YdcC
MGAVSKQARRALRHVPWEWSREVEDPRDRRGQRHAHPGVLGLLVAAFACAKVGLEEAEELSKDLGPRTRKKLKLKGPVSDSTLWRLLEQQSPKGLRETLREWVKALLRPGTFEPLLPLGVASFDGKSLYTSTQQVGAKQGESPAFRVLWPRVVEHFLLGVRQTHLKKDGLPKVEWRYFVTSLSTVDLSFKHLLKLVRLHWAIENQHHWTLDVVLKEDARQPCMASASSLEVTAWLRTLAYNLLAVWRAMLSLHSRTRVRWKRACEKLRDALVGGLKEVSLPTPA